MPNKILATQLVKTVTYGGKSITLKYATKTERWNRSYLAQSVLDDFGTAVGKAKLPAGVAVAILTEKEHPSRDRKRHFTIVFEDAHGNHIVTRHIYR